MTPLQLLAAVVFTVAVMLVRGFVGRSSGRGVVPLQGRGSRFDSGPTGFPPSSSMGSDGNLMEHS